MRVLTLTSDDTVRGLKSDDDFEIGRFTLGNTIGLLVVTAVIGVLVALVFLAARPFVARFGRAVVPMMAALYGILGGAMMVHRDGIDFQVLEPVLLAITLFVACLCRVRRRSRMARQRGGRRRRLGPHEHLVAVGPPLVLLVFPPFALAAFAAGAFNWLVDVTNPEAGTLARVIEVAAYVAMSALFVFGVVDLAQDTIAVHLSNTRLHCATLVARLRPRVRSRPWNRYSTSLSSGAGRPARVVARLSEDPTCRVALLEAGGPPPPGSRCRPPARRCS